MAQCELHPYLTRDDIVAKCTENNIVLQAYSPLTKAEKLKDPKLVAVAEKYGKTTAQVLIRWSLQRGFVVLPKSVTPSRIEQNIDVFDFNISDEDMATLNGFDEYYVTGALIVRGCSTAVLTNC